MMPTKEELIKELTFKTSRSGGKGGQHVNKVSSKVELIFDIEASAHFSVEEKERLLAKLAAKLDTEGLLHVIAQADRSQLVNKQLTIDKLLDMLTKGLAVPKKRKPTKIPKAVIEKRLNNKLATSAKKESRKKPLL